MLRWLDLHDGSRLRSLLQFDLQTLVRTSQQIDDTVHVDPPLHQVIALPVLLLLKQESGRELLREGTVNFLQELIRQIILFKARNFLAPLDLQLRHRHQAAVDILRIRQQSGFVVGVDGHL